MSVQITTNTSLSGIVTSIKAVLPPFFTKTTGTVLHNLLEGIGTLFKLNIEQINQKYNDTFIAHATGSVLDDLITDISKIHRKDSESDDDYRNRHYKYLFDYNITKGSIIEQVYDITGEEPTLVVNLLDRTAYWGEENLPVSGQITGTASFYDVEGSYSSLWGGSVDDSAFKAYVYLRQRPTPEVLSDLKYVINRNRIEGGKIYLVFPFQSVYYDNAMSLYDSENSIYT